MSDFTPGPWHVGGSLISAQGGGTIARALLRHNWRKSPDYDAEAPDNRATFEANARLIAAAPDLYAALRFLVDGDGQPDECPRAMQAARAALRKADARYETKG